MTILDELRKVIRKAERGEDITVRDISIVAEAQGQYCDFLDGLLETVEVKPKSPTADGVADKVLSYWYAE